MGHAIFFFMMGLLKVCSFVHWEYKVLLFVCFHEMYICYLGTWDDALMLCYVVLLVSVLDISISFSPFVD